MYIRSEKDSIDSSSNQPHKHSLQFPNGRHRRSYERHMELWGPWGERLPSLGCTTWLNLVSQKSLWDYQLSQHHRLFNKLPLSHWQTLKKSLQLTSIMISVSIGPGCTWPAHRVENLQKWCVCQMLLQWQMQKGFRELNWTPLLKKPMCEILSCTDVKLDSKHFLHFWVLNKLTETSHWTIKLRL